ncbi:MAG: (Fe-S)-binding protein [Deltaproteobacteria bacterium]|nr:(Fe-S)-binding protein [Deltaproteobacteria bacterium]
MDLFKAFDTEKCTLCGECFYQCPVMKLPLDVAKDEIVRLINGDETRSVLQKCTSCFACNFICPERCNPAQLILDRWHEKYLREGLLLRAEYFIPHNRPNFRTYVLDRLPDDEKMLVESWDDTSSCEEIFYPGCNVITVPYLTKTKLLEGLNIRGSLDMCCGEMYYRMGLYDQVKQVAKKLEKHFNKMGVKKMIIPCTAGRNMFTNVLPKFGAHFDFEIQHILPWILEKIESGEIEIKNKLDMTVTIQESCYGKMFGGEYLDIPRKILEKIGARVIEEDLCREKALCCGIAGGFSPTSSYHPLHITLSTIRSLRLAQNTGAQAIVAYCAGCLQLLSVGQIAYPIKKMPVYHILELLQMAIGETPDRRNTQRAWQFLAGTVINQFPKVLSNKRFYVEEID